MLAVPGAPGQEPALDDWDADYAKPRNTNAMRAQGPTIAHLEAENAALRASNGIRMQAGSISRWETENAALKLNNKATVSGATETRMPFHPEFAFMRETFARGDAELQRATCGDRDRRCRSATSSCGPQDEDLAPPRQRQFGNRHARSRHPPSRCTRAGQACLRYALPSFPPLWRRS
ncbi:hypothetical protein B0H14DRAFT_2812213, partial [Mycena olivaceomarginata]